MIGLTMEADNALRIAFLLGSTGEVTDTPTLAKAVAVPTRFALKILRKLTQGGIVTSRRGKNGGYLLAKAPTDISVRQIIELIDGPILVNRCVDENNCCSRMGYDKAKCAFHRLFAAESERLANTLDRVTLQHILDESDNCGPITNG